MNLSKNILTSALAIMVALSVIVGTLLYAYQYTLNNSTKNNSLQKGKGRMPQNQSQKKDSTMFQGGPSNGDFKKPEN